VPSGNLTQKWPKRAAQIGNQTVDIVDILDAVVIRLPCKRCGQAYEVPLQDVLISHNIMKHRACSIPRETECPPLAQICLAEQEDVEALQSAWNRLQERAQKDGGELVLIWQPPPARRAAVGGLPEPAAERREISMKNTQEQPTSQSTRIDGEGESLCLDLAAEIEALHREPAWQTGISRKALIKYPDFRLTLIALKDKSRIEEHHNPGRISVHTVAGHIRMHAAGKSFDLSQGRVLILDRAVRHDVEALEESAFLLTIAPPTER
jgi:quercetin dioxygenase-like cupin family protein